MRVIMVLRREEDSNPRCPRGAQRFSRPPRSTTPASLLERYKNNNNLPTTGEYNYIRRLNNTAVMHSMRPYIPITLLLVFFLECNRSESIITDEVTYKESIEEWQHRRLERLKSKSGWLNLAGLFWLEEGENSFGSDPSNRIRFPEKADPFSGTLTLKDSVVTLHVREGVQITIGDSLVTHAELMDDHTRGTTHVSQGDLAWYIIKRGDKYGIRLRDFKHPRLEELDHIPSYPIQTGYVVEGTLKPFSEPRTMTVATPVEGFTEEYQCPGELHFKINKRDLVL